MANSTMNVRLPNKLLSAIDEIAKENNMTRTDVVHVALCEFVENYNFENTGGGTLTIPNPAINKLDELQICKACTVLADAHAKLIKISPNLDFGLDDIRQFVIARTMTDSKETKLKFSKRLEGSVDEI